MNGSAANVNRGQANIVGAKRGTLSLVIEEAYLLMGVMAIAFVSHTYNMFNYPLYLGDEGIYMEQAWSVLTDGKLSPYTYFYDHAPVGWFLLAWWGLLLPGKLLAFGMAINSGRVLMAVLHVASTFFLYRTTKKLSGSDMASVAASIVFSLSPMALFYQRMVLLDNIMVFWILLALYLIVVHGDRVLTLIGSGFAFSMALLTKENAIFFAPVFAYIIYSNLKGKYQFRFSAVGWMFTMLAIVSLYPIYALLKSELLPSTLQGLGSSQSPGERVSLIGTVIWQMGRSQGSILDPNSLFWEFSLRRWWPKDSFLVAIGFASVLVALLLGLHERKHRKGLLYASLLSLAYIFYMARGSVMLEFYVVPLLPFLAMTIGMMMARIFQLFPGRLIQTSVFTIALFAIVYGSVQASRDHYTLNLTQVQHNQLQYIRENIPPDAIMIVDDDLWVDLHDGGKNYPSYPNAHSHWKVTGDPEIRDKLLKNDWRNVDYVIVSNKLPETLQINGEKLVQDAIANSTLMARFEKGDVAVEVRRVNKPGRTPPAQTPQRGTTPQRNR